MVKLIAAVDKNMAVGARGKLPWAQPSWDAVQFRLTTYNSTIVMGRGTFESIGRPLPGRLNIVMTTDMAKAAAINKKWFPRVLVCGTVESALNRSAGGLWAIGGKGIWQAFAPYADELKLTWIHGEHEADAYFPAYLLGVFKRVAHEEVFPDGTIERRFR